MLLRLDRNQDIDTAARNALETRQKSRYRYRARSAYGDESSSFMEHASAFLARFSCNPRGKSTAGEQRLTTCTTHAL